MEIRILNQKELYDLLHPEDVDINILHDEIELALSKIHPKGYKCPFCKKKKTGIIPIPYALNPHQEVPSELKYMYLISLVCEKCGHTDFFNAKILGLGA